MRSFTLFIARIISMQNIRSTGAFYERTFSRLLLCGCFGSSAHSTRIPIFFLLHSFGSNRVLNVFTRRTHIAHIQSATKSISCPSTVRKDEWKLCIGFSARISLIAQKTLCAFVFFLGEIDPIHVPFDCIADVVGNWQRSSVQCTNVNVRLCLCSLRLHPEAPSFYQRKIVRNEKAVLELE